jgi:predicted anti-sigma-YlaC factor YlaD
VTCDEVRDRLAEHLLGTLDEVTDAAIRSHLRSCGGCRREMAALADGMATFSRAAHEVQPPPELRDRVLGAVAEEWAAMPEPTKHRRPRRTWIASAVAAAAVFASLGWGMSQANVASRYEASATKYEAFLHALGGKNVRVGVIQPSGTQDIHGSAVLYDSDVQQSWVLILVRAPGMTGSANVELSSEAGHTIEMHPLEFSDGGESSSWLVTSSNLQSFDTVTITDASGHIVARAAVQKR